MRTVVIFAVDFEEASMIGVLSSPSSSLSVFSRLLRPCAAMELVAVELVATRPEEGEPPAGPFALSIRTLTGGTTTLRDVVSSQTVHAVTAAAMR